MFVDVDQGSETIHGSNVYNRQEVELIIRTIQTLLPRNQPNLLPSVTFKLSFVKSKSSTYNLDQTLV